MHPGMFIFVSLRQCSSHLLLSASTRFIVRVLSACVICTLPHLGILWFIRRVFVFFVALISGGVFFCCALVPGTLALDLPTLILERGLVFFSVSLSVTTEFVSLYDEGSGRTLGVLLMMSLGRKNERFNVKFFFLHIKPFVLSTQHQQYPQCPS